MSPGDWHQRKQSLTLQPLVHRCSIPSRTIYVTTLLSHRDMMIVERTNTFGRSKQTFSPRPVCRGISLSIHPRLLLLQFREKSTKRTKRTGFEEIREASCEHFVVPMFAAPLRLAPVRSGPGLSVGRPEGSRPLFMCSHISLTAYEFNHCHKLGERR